MKFDYSSLSSFCYSGCYYDVRNIDVDRAIISIEKVCDTVIIICIILIKNNEECKYNYKFSFVEFFKNSVARKLLSKKSAIKLIQEGLFRGYPIILVGKSLSIDINKNIKYYEFNL